LKDERARAVVEDALLHFNGLHHVVYAYVVMPNHVHVLFMPLGESSAGVLHGWKSYSATMVNRLHKSSGAFWQKESWDHLVRNERQFAKFVKYINANDPDNAWSAYDA